MNLRLGSHANFGRRRTFLGLWRILYGKTYNLTFSENGCVVAHISENQQDPQDQMKEVKP
jgi:hypothetical protein